MKFCEKLRLLREERNLTMTEFATLLGTSKQVISRYERGDNTPKITTVAHYANVLNVSLEYLMNDDVIDKSGANVTKNSPEELALSEGEKNLLIFYRGLSDEAKKAFDDAIGSLDSFSEEKQKLALQMLHFALGNQ